MDSSLVGYDDGLYVWEERRVEREPQPNDRIAGDGLLKALGIDPDKWTLGDRRIALLGIGIGLTIVIVSVCGYLFGWAWTGLTEPGITEPKQRTFWDWLSLLIVPIVLALGGYLFTRSENRRTQEFADQQRTLDREIADEQRTLDREIADQRQQDDMLQAYLDGMSQLLTDKDRPLHRAPQGDSLRTVARARTLTVLSRLDGPRKGSVVQFLYESSLVTKDDPILDVRDSDLSKAYLSFANLNLADLSEADLSEAYLSGANLRYANLSNANLSNANLSNADLFYARGMSNEDLEQQAKSLEGATMPNGQKYDEWLKSREEGWAGG